MLDKNGKPYGNGVDEVNAQEAEGVSPSKITLSKVINFNKHKGGGQSDRGAQG
jgi:hypothetical protein